MFNDETGAIYTVWETVSLEEMGPYEGKWFYFL